MRLEQFEFVLEVATQKSMIKASEALHTSVQNVSKGIKQLEEELKVQIFSRNKYGVFLTAEGEEICKEAAVIMQSVNRLKENYVRKNGVEQTVPVGDINVLTAHASSIATSDTLEKVCLKYRPEKASVLTYDALTINERISSDLDGMLDEYDMVLTNILQSELDTNKKKLDEKTVFFLRKDRLGVRVNNESRFATQSTIAIKDIITEPLIHASPDKDSLSHLQMAIESMGVSLQAKYAVNTTDSCTRYVDNGLGYTFATYSESEIEEQQRYGKNSTVIPLREKIFFMHILIVNDRFKESEAYEYTMKQFAKIYPGMKPLE